MTLTATVLNSDATLNTFITTGSFSFIPGETKTLVLRLIDTDKNLRYIPPSTAVITGKFRNLDGEEMPIEFTAFPDDRSMIYIDLTATQTENLASGNLLLELDILGDQTKIVLALARSILARQALGNFGC